MNKSLKGAILLALAAFIWGTGFVAQSLGMEHIGPFTFNGVRTLVGGVFLLPVIFFISKSRKSMGVETDSAGNRLFIPAGILCGLFLCAASSLQQIGIQYTSAGKAGFLTALYIVMVPIIGIFMKKFPGVKVWIGVVIAAIGTYILSVKDGFAIESGDLYIICSAFIFSFHIIVIGHFSPKTDAVKMSCVQFFTAGIIAVVIAIFVEKPLMADILASWGPILYAGIISSGIAYTLQIVGQRDTPPAVASLILSLESVFAVLAGWVILGEQLSPKELFGCVLVFAAVILAQLPSFKPKKMKA